MYEDLICQAIAERRILTFSYKDNERTVEPHALGYDADNDLTLCGWQVSGGSGVDFRDFHVRQISTPSLSQQTFSGPRPKYKRHDKTLRRIICQL